MPHTYFITGIGTEVGKTIAAAILTEALKADYWKPIQAGDLDNSDTQKVQNLVSNEVSFFHPTGHALETPMSPHAAAELDGVHLTAGKLAPPKTSNTLVIEGAGGLLVPINDSETIADLIRPDFRVILVSRHYLGSINHTLLTLEALRHRGISCHGIIFNGKQNSFSEDIILKMFQVPVIGRINPEKSFDQDLIRKYALNFRNNLTSRN